MAQLLHAYLCLAIFMFRLQRIELKHGLGATVELHVIASAGMKITTSHAVCIVILLVCTLLWTVVFCQGM